MPWNRNEGRHDLPSSGHPGQELRSPPGSVASPEPPEPQIRRRRRRA
jgi:hypothetical protein